MVSRPLPSSHPSHPQAALEWASQRIICPVVVSDKEAVVSTAQFAVDHRVNVEPSCGAALAAAAALSTAGLNTDDVASEHRWARNVSIPPEGPIIIVVCGGNMASPALLGSYAHRVGAMDEVEALDVAPYHWRYWLRNQRLIAASAAAGGFLLGLLLGRERGLSAAVRKLTAL
jgi:hypothetical protein